MGILKRLAAALAVVAIALLLTGTGTAAADDGRPDVPYPTQGPTFSTTDTSSPGGIGDQLTDTYNSCATDLHSGTDSSIWDGFVNGLVNPFICSHAAAAVTAVQGSAAVLSWGASKLWGDPVGKFANAVMEGNVQAFVTVMTFWMSVPTGSLTATDAINGIRNMTWELQLVAMAFGIATGAIRVAMARRHAVADGAEETAKMLVRTLFAVSTLPVLVMTLHRVGDSFSTWVLKQASDGDINAKINALAWVNAKSGMGPILALLLAGIATFGSIAQLIALLIREAVLSIAVAVAPIAAASSVTGTGRQSWSSITSYILAALLFKPAASLVYAFAFWAATSTSVIDAVIGAVLLAVAGVSLPALVRVIAPAVSTISAGAGQAAGIASGAGAGASKASGGANWVTNKINSNSGPSTSTTSASGSGLAPASGSGQSNYRGQYSGSNSASGGGAATSRSGGIGGRAAGALGGGVKAAAVGVKAAAGAVRMVGSGTSSLGGFAEGAISHGQVPR